LRRVQRHLLQPEARRDRRRRRPRGRVGRKHHAPGLIGGFAEAAPAQEATDPRERETQADGGRHDIGDGQERIAVPPHPP
jgi:hypothetical protein